MMPSLASQVKVPRGTSLVAAAEHVAAASLVALVDGLAAADVAEPDCVGMEAVLEAPGMPSVCISIC